jgi:hypothetical protein
MQVLDREAGDHAAGSSPDGGLLVWDTLSLYPPGTLWHGVVRTVSTTCHSESHRQGRPARSARRAHAAVMT